MTGCAWMNVTSGSSKNAAARHSAAIRDRPPVHAPPSIPTRHQRRARLAAIVRRRAPSITDRLVLCEVHKAVVVAGESGRRQTAPITAAWRAVRPWVPTANPRASHRLETLDTSKRRRRAKRQQTIHDAERHATEDGEQKWVLRLIADVRAPGSRARSA